MVFLLDNYDSFTWNLAQLLGALGAVPTVRRNDEVTVRNVREAGPDRIVISPGPCTPSEAGVSVALVRELGPEIPILGVCLGHQAIGEAYGGRTIRASRVMHGKTSAVHHSGQGIFRGVPTPFEAARYHSLVTDPDVLPDELLVVAHAREEGREEVQAMRHRTHPVWGVQFHPESLFSTHGERILRNFLALQSSSTAL